MSAKFKNLGIKAKLIIIMTGLIVASCAILTIVSVWESIGAAKVNVEMALAQTAKLGTEVVEQKLINQKSVIEAIAFRNVIRGDDWQLQSQAMNQEIQHYGFLGLGIVDRNYKAKYPDGTSADLSGRKYIQSAFMGETVFSDVIISKVTKSAVIMLATPVKDIKNPSMIKAVLIARLPATILSDVTDNIRYGKGGYSWIIDHSGTLIAHDNRDFVLDRRNFIDESRNNSDFRLLAAMMGHMIKGDTGTDQYLFMGHERFFAYAPIKGTTWSMAVGAQASDIFARINSMRNIIIGISCIVIIVSVFIAIAIAVNIARPLVKAAQVAKAIANGDFSQKVNLNSMDEIGQLARAVDNVPATLQQMAEQFNHLSKAAEAGDLTFRGEADKFQGEYKSIINIVNTTLDNISKPINDSMQVLDKLKVNDISQEVNENGLKGDYLKIAQAVNSVKKSLGNILSTMVNISKGDISDLERYEKAGKKSDNDELIPAIIRMCKAIKALIEDANTLAQAGQKGKLDVRADASVHHGAYRDIVEGVNNILDSVVTPLNEAATVLRAAAEKDLSKNFTSHCEGDFENLKNDINGLIDSMNDALSQVGEAVQQVTAGGDQIAEASQSLSQGATEQAASLEEISSSMTQIGSQINTNAENANNASKLAHSAKQAAQTGGKNMEEMVSAMKDISSSSEQIAKVNKVIDDIAFQTNLLALNAAVEAARAGVHGKGFAVVAGEVRNLASRSAKAAQETAEIIEESLHKVQNGLAVASSTQETFQTILDGIIKVTDLSGEIAAASSEQAQGISQINQGLTQIDQVTQQNTAHAEETAAASEELSGQANQLQSLIRQFNLKHNLAEMSRPQSRPKRSLGASRPTGGGGRMVQMTNSPNKKASPDVHHDNWGKGAGKVKPEELISFDDDDFGKF